MKNRKPLIGLMVIILALFVAGVGMCEEINKSANESAELREEQNKVIILRVYDEAFGQGKTEIINELFSEDYIQHNPMVPNGPEGLIGYIEMLKSMDPAPVITVKHILADGDLVAVHWHSSTTPENESSGQAGFDLYRLDNGTIVEHWDVIQDVPAKTASGNSMFSDLYKEGNA